MGDKSPRKQNKKPKLSTKEKKAKKNAKQAGDSAIVVPTARAVKK